MLLSRMQVAVEDVDNWGPDVAFGGWRSAVSDIEEAVWKGLAFPELHTAAGHLMAELAKAGLLPDIFAAMMEHPPVVGLGGTTLPQGREPSDVQPPRDPRFQSMSIPGYNMIRDLPWHMLSYCFCTLRALGSSICESFF
ncbi:unnamed protein product [Symbiodinium microadriaticum]|nr:unnamed protein product [Symbiodinium microadriaticum]